jgi:outer membrane lipoprotein LolB
VRFPFPALRRAALAATFALAACATVKPSAPPEGGFELQGRVAVHYGSDGASGRISWRHSPEYDELLIASAIGQGVAKLRRTGSEIELVAQGKEYRAADAESLTERVLGWRLPLGGLSDWVQGRPSPDAPAQVERDANNRIAVLRQDDWKIEYQEYDGDRPSRLRLARPGLEIRMIVDQWSQ